MSEVPVSRSTQVRALFLINIKEAIRNRRVVLLSTYFPVIYAAIGVIIAKTTSNSQNLGAQVAVPILPETLATSTPILLPYVFDDTAVWSPVWSGTLFPELSTLFAPLAPNWTQFSTMQGIIDYQLDQNLKLVQNESAAVQRPAAGYELDLLHANGSTGKLDFGYTVLYGNNPLSAPVMINAMNWAAALVNLPANGLSPATVNITTGLMTFPAQLSENLDLGAIFIPPFMTMSLSFLSTVFVQSLVMQREKGQRTLLTVQGVSGSTYYLAAFCRDIILYLMPLVLDFIIMYSVQLPIFINTSPLPWLLLAILAGPPIILQAYFFSFFFKRSGTVGPVVGFGQALLIFIPYFIVTFATNGQVPSWIAYLLTIVLTPTFGLQFAFKNLSEAEINNTPYTAADTFNPSYPILGTLLCLISGGVFYAILLYRLDYRMSIKQDFSRWRNRFSLIPQAAPQVTKEDDSISIDVDRQRMEDVVLVQETNRLKRGELTEEDVVVVQGLGKTFLDRTGGKKNVKVLEDLWMAVRTKECFGYLGPNGAGKTTTIKVLTGQEKTTVGTASIASHSIIPFSRAIPTLIGVCPQDNPVWEQLTGREHLRCFATIKGVPKGGVETEVNRVIQAMSIHEVADRRVKEYSGGNLRRLMLGIAIIGSPAIIFLDEPTTGVDVAVRQSIWTAIRELKKKCSIILTTHSMEEAEALCDRIGIIVNGRLQALGTPQRLKNVYGAGYKLVIKTRTSQTTPEVIRIIQDEFPGATLVQNLGNRVEFEVLKEEESDVPSSSTGVRVESAKKTTRFLARLFDVLQKERENQEIMDYSVSQTSLAQVFIEFAREQKVL